MANQHECAYLLLSLIDDCQDPTDRRHIETRIQIWSRSFFTEFVDHPGGGLAGPYCIRGNDDIGIKTLFHKPFTSRRSFIVTTLSKRPFMVGHRWISRFPMPRSE